MKENIYDVMDRLSPADVDVLLENCGISESENGENIKTEEMSKKVAGKLGKEEKTKRKPFPLRYRIGVVAAMLCAAIVITAVIRPEKRMMPGRIYDYLGVPELVSLDNDNGTISKKTDFYGARTLSVNINYLPVSGIISSVVGSGAERDVCIDMIGYFFYSAVSFDFRTHFLLFEKEAVDHYLSEEGLYSGKKWALDEESGIYKKQEGTWTYDGFIEELARIPDMIGIGSADVSFAVKEVYGYRGKDLEPVIERFHHEAGLDEVMDYDKITEVRIYKISDVKYVYNGREEFGDLDEFYNSFCFYRYDNVWYILPNMAQVDSTVDIFSNITLEKVKGYVTEMGEDYLTVFNGNGFVDFIGKHNGGFKVGDYVSVTGTGVHGLGFLKLKSCEVIAEK